MTLIRFFVLVFFFALPAAAELRIDVTGARSEPTPVAFPDIGAYTPETQAIAADMARVIESDLVRSGLFRIVNRDAYIQHLASVSDRPRFADWQAIKAHALIQAQLDAMPDGAIRISFRLWDVFMQQQMEDRVLSTAPDGWRKLAHRVADIVYSRITGETGYFDTKVAFISETGNQRKRTKRLAVMDSDGANVRYLTDGADMVLTPRFSPNMREIAYFSYKGGQPRVYIMDLATNASRLVGQFAGMTFAPRFSPDGRKLIMSLATRGNSDIYLHDLATGQTTQLTNNPAIDTSPSFAPDGKKIVFNSDRSGRQQLYVMDADGGNVRRISFGEGSYATPVWSPRGDYIAFTKIKDGQFHIGLMRPDGAGERLIVNGWAVEAPSWAPNGRVLSFFRQEPWDERGAGGRTKIYTIDVTGYHEQLIPTPQDASSPAWSPLLH
ncbi:MAG: Tol-Pal system beta propeller repeat protein TolB [Alphaproteobacteria bacterium]|nr:Tol-Pal system beta propeller repeat protein TolB [Alphaproteobacteria bacterium]